MTAAWLPEIVPLVTGNVALLWPAGIVTLVGSEIAALLLLSATTTALATALLNVTVQAPVAFSASVDGEHAKPVS
jgi:hypothetical protein